MPFKKGQSGNPNGRPAVAKGFRDRCKEFMDAQGWDHLAQLATQTGRDQMAALGLIASYAYGKPTQPIGGDPDQPLAIRVVYENGPITSAASDPGAHHR